MHLKYTITRTAFLILRDKMKLEIDHIIIYYYFGISDLTKDFIYNRPFTLIV